VRKWLLAFDELETSEEFIECLLRFEPEYTKEEFEQLINC